jgi:hypothetical protein
LHGAFGRTAGTDALAATEAGRLNISQSLIRRPAQMDPVSSRVWKICGFGETHARINTNTTVENLFGCMRVRLAPQGV